MNDPQDRLWKTEDDQGRVRGSPPCPLHFRSHKERRRSCETQIIYPRNPVTSLTFSSDEDDASDGGMMLKQDA